LAREKTDETAQRTSIEIVEFTLASESYGIETAWVREVYPLKDMTTLPGVPPFIEGIMSVRGQIVSVLNLKVFFSLPEKGLGELNKVIILRSADMEFGVLTDSIKGNRAVPLDSIRPSPVSAGGISAAFIRGVTKDHTIILDAEALLTRETIVVYQDAM
jgi:purine-binding chemotaxis protein CheW